MRKFLGLAVGSLLCVLAFATVSMAQNTGWDFSVRGIDAVAEKSRTGNYYRVYVTVDNESTNKTYGGYGTVKVVLVLSNPDGGDEIFNEVENVEIENGSSEKVEFSFNRDIHYSYLDYRINLKSPGGGIFDNESGNISVDWRESDWD